MQLRRDEYGFVAELPNGRLAEIMPLTFGRARICLLNEHSRFCYDDMW